MGLFLFNTKSRKKELFSPINPPQVLLYTCGPTVYHYAHIGNLRTFIFDDLLERVLLANNFTVDRVMNITDVGHLTSDADEGEDKMEKGSAREGKNVWDIAKLYTEVFIEDLKKLHCKIPVKLPRATEFIAQIITLIQQLEQKGFTYQTSDGVYFDTAKFSRYGDFAKLNIEGMQEGARVEVNKEKRNLTDFALWKFSPPNSTRQMEWESPWGKGFPGWHIECSAMAMELLGETIDIHTGGVDHIAVHHSNEIAQSECATGKLFARIWMHGEFLILGDQEKMAKSGDNFLTLQTLIDQGINPLAYRYLCLMTHYRSKLHFSWDALQSAQTGLQNLRARVATLQGETNEGVLSDETVIQRYKEQFMGCMNDDLNAPRGLDVLGKMLKEHDLETSGKLSLLKYFDSILSLGLSDLVRFAFTVPFAIESDVNLTDQLYKGMFDLLQQRKDAREAKRWQDSDRLRDEILNRFRLQIEDIPGGKVIVKRRE